MGQYFHPALSTRVTSLAASPEHLSHTKTWLLSPGTSLGDEKDLLSKAARGSRGAHGGDGGTHRQEHQLGWTGHPTHPEPWGSQVHLI